MRRGSLRPARLAERAQAKPQFGEAVKSLASIIPNAATFLVGISAVAYFCGWREASSYYTALGAPWMVANLPSFAFLSLSGPMMVVIAFAAFLSMEQVAFLGGTGKGIGRVASVLLLLGIFTPHFATIFVDRFTEQGIWILQRISAFLTYFAAGLFVGQAGAEMRDSGLKWSRAVVNPIFFLVNYGLLQAPTLLGNAHAHYDLLPASTELSVVQMKDEKGIVNWRLVNVTGGSALLLKPSSVKNGHVLRLIEAKEIPAIFTPKTN